MFFLSVFSFLPVDSFAFEPGRLCRHPSIRTLGWAIFARCMVGVPNTVGAATW